MPPEWMQLDLFTYDEFVELLERKVVDLTTDHAKMKIYFDYCLNRWGKSPAMPLIVRPDIPT